MLSTGRGVLKLRVINVTRRTTLGDLVDIADTSLKRRTGLLKHERLQDGAGLWIVPCGGVHTVLMRFVIDVIYLDRNQRVRKIVCELAPWRLSYCLLAHSALEFPAGYINRSGTRKGDQLDLQVT
jgi:uncharacterized membrane protein (UPF0127 family)